MSEQITYPCAHCGKPIDDGAGFLTIDTATALDYLAHAKQQIRDEDTDSVIRGKSWGELRAEQDNAPPKAEWTTVHTICAQENPAGYNIPVAKVRTYRSLNRWTAHLMDKNWFHTTNWPTVLRNALKQTPGEL